MATKKHFGTDGIRGKVGEFPITADFLIKLGWAVGKVLSADKNKEVKVVMGKDTRISGYMIESALEAGLSAAGVNIYLLGPLPTSAIAYLTLTMRADLGIVISASHNPFEDNGIKFFSSDGFKLPASFEKQVEHWLTQPMETATSVALGRAFRVDDAQGRYIEFCKSCLPHHTNFSHLKIVLDCADGATYHIAPYVFRELGANVIETFTTPNGLNINENCGSMHPQVLRERVLMEKADLGIAFDGDGDRVVMVDHTGEILDGDELLYIIIKGLIKVGRFSGGVVSSLMSNLGLEHALAELNIPFARVPVGDQHIIETLLEKNWIIGGEPSGHLILPAVTTTADGIITALQALQAMIVCGENLHGLKTGIKKYPQRIINIRHNGHRIDLDGSEVTAIVKEAEDKLGKSGRILLRFSGTEPVLRIMIEGKDQALVDKLAEKLQQSLTAMVNTAPHDS